MPKKLLEIKEFTSGTVLNPSERDIDINAASDSLNIDCISEDGALRGISNDKIVTNSSSVNLSVNSSKFGEFNIDGSKQLLYYDDSDDKLKLVLDDGRYWYNKDDIPDDVMNDIKLNIRP